MKSFIQDLVQAVLRRGAQSTDVDGLSVLADTHDDLQRILDAIHLIRAVDPRRHARQVKDLRRVWATILPGPLGQFRAKDWTCELDQRFVARSTAAEIASVIVHEATHARLWRRGVRYDADIRYRVEAICFRQEQVFARRLAGSDAPDERLRAYLDLPSEFWSDRAMRRSHVRGSVSALRHLKVPRWMIGVVLRGYRAKRRRERRAEAMVRS